MWGFYDFSVPVGLTSARSCGNVLNSHKVRRLLEGYYEVTQQYLRSMILNYYCNWESLKSRYLYLIQDCLNAL